MPAPVPPPRFGRPSAGPLRRGIPRTCRAPSGRLCGLPPPRSSSPSSCPCSHPPFPPPSHAPFRSKFVPPAPGCSAPRAVLGLAPGRDQIAHALPSEPSDLLVELDPPLRLDGEAALAPADQSPQPPRLADGHAPRAPGQRQFRCRPPPCPPASLPP